MNQPITSLAKILLPLVLAICLGWSSLALAQSDEPTLPPSGKTLFGADEPGGAKSVDEPGGAKSVDEPGGAKSVDEPGGAKSVDEPQTLGANGPTTEATLKAKAAARYGLGLQLRGIFFPHWFLKSFFSAATSVSSTAIGGEFVRRKGNFDLVSSINFGFYNPQDGNYMGKNKDPNLDSDYVQFRKLHLLAFDLGFLWHHYFNDWMSLVYGAGLGLGVVFDDIRRVSNTNCNLDNVENIDQCHPLGMDPANRETWLAQNTGTEKEDSPLNPKLWKEEGVWPVIPVVHLLIGMNFKISEQFSLRVDGGFHNAFYFGAATHYFF